MTELPSRITGPSAWYGPDMAGRSDWIEPLSPADLAEIESASRRLAQTANRLADPCRDDFPLPTSSADCPASSRGAGRTGLCTFTRSAGRTLGPAIVGRGLPGAGAALGELALAKQARASARSRERRWALRARIRRFAFTRPGNGKTTTPIPVTSVGLLCLHPARSGGLSSLVSSVTMFNEMRSAVRIWRGCCLSRIETDRRGEVPAGQKPYFCIPVFNWHAGLLSTIYNRSYIESARRFPDVPPLTAEQVEALDLFDALANDPALHFQMELQTGDIQLVHNHTLLHDRTAFEDWPEPERKRHLLRLWLAPEKPGRCPRFSRSGTARSSPATGRHRGSGHAIHNSVGGR